LSGVEETYRKTASFRFDVHYHGPGRDGKILDFDIALAAERHGRLSIHLRETAGPASERREFTMVDDGRAFHIYAAPSGEYRHDAPGSKLQLDACSSLIELLITRFDHLAEDLANAQPIGEEVVNTPGGPVRCTVMRGDRSGIRDFWVDESRKVLLRERIDQIPMLIRVDADGRQTRTPLGVDPKHPQRVLEWRRVEIDPALGPSDFAFTLPAGAHQANWLLPVELPWPSVPHLPARPN
jgi:hypothetical protein